MKRRLCLLLSVLFLLIMVTGCSNEPADDDRPNSSSGEVKASEDKETATDSVSSAAELASLTVPELIDLMGGKYNYEQDASTFYMRAFPESCPDEYGLDHGFYIYNYDVFPGMHFYIGDNASSDYFSLGSSDGKEKAVEQTAKNLTDGKYQTIDEIIIFDSAKLDDSFSADMSYSQVTDVLGYVPATTYGPDMVRLQLSQYNEDIESVFIYLEKPESVDPEQQDAVSREIMEKDDPKTLYICVRPNNPGGWRKSYINYLKQYYSDTDYTGFLFSLANGNIPEMVLIDEDNKLQTKLLHIDPSASANEEVLGEDTESVLYLKKGHTILHSGCSDGVTTVTVYHLDSMGPDYGGFRELLTEQYKGDVRFSDAIYNCIDGVDPGIKVYMDKEGKEITKDEFFDSLKAVFDYSDPELQDLINSKSFKKLNSEYVIMHSFTY